MDRSVIIGWTLVHDLDPVRLPGPTGGPSDRVGDKRVAAPLVFYLAVTFLATLVVTRRCGFGYQLSCTQSFTAASNNFKLAIAVAIATFGVDSDQALAATVGPLVEVPVLLGLVYVVKWFGKRNGWKA